LTLEGETWQPGYYRINNSDLLQGSIAAEFAFKELKAIKAATVHDGSPYANQLQAVFANRFQGLGCTITFQGAVNVGDTDMRTVLTSVAVDSPDVLYFPIFEPEGPFIVAQSSEIAGLENTILLGADGLLARSFPSNAGSNVVGMYLTGPYVSGPKYDELLAKWRKKFGSIPPSGFHAFAYDATNLLLDAIKEVAVFDRDGTIYIGRQALRDALNSVTDYEGITGKLSCEGKDYSALGIQNTVHGDYASGESLGIFQITQDELDGNWPPPVAYTPRGNLP
jgi:branched-chain amino acid transport system substrate-binding protein